MNPITTIPCCATLLLASAIAAAGNYEVRQQSIYETAAKVCQGALPQFAGTLRARPLALGNEGSTPAFATCGWEGMPRLEGGYGRDLKLVRALLGNPTLSDLSFSCTIVKSPSAPVYYTRPVMIAAGGTAEVDLSQADLDEDQYLDYTQISCELPPGAVIHALLTIYDEEV